MHWDILRGAPHKVLVQQTNDEYPEKLLIRVLLLVAGLAILVAGLGVFVYAHAGWFCCLPAPLRLTLIGIAIGLALTAVLVLLAPKQALGVLTHPRHLFGQPAGARKHKDRV